MKDTIAIIPARKNSKRLKFKNIKDFMGKPLIYYTIKSALKSNFISEVIVSTDCKKTKKISEKFGAKVPYLRDRKLSSDNATTIQLIQDLFFYLSKVVLMQNKYLIEILFYLYL